jgi:hypothetical protein
VDPAQGRALSTSESVVAVGDLALETTEDEAEEVRTITLFE